jgi:hypothetical protein
MKYLEACYGAVQIIFVGAFNFHRSDLADM